MTCALRIGLLFLACAALIGTAHAQDDDASTETRYGVPPDGALILDLSGTWRVQTAPFLDNTMTQPDYDDRDWREVEVPARWSAQAIEPNVGMPLVAVYRRTFLTRAEWTGQPVGVAAWLNPGHSTVTLNGVRLESEGDAPWLYAEVTDRLDWESDNVIVVTTQFDGAYEMAFANPPRVGPLGEWELPALQETPVSLEVAGETIEATLYTASPDEALPGVLMIGTGSHGLAFTEPFLPLARELAYTGYAALPVALNAQTPENIDQALDALRNLPAVDGNRIAVIAAVASATAVLTQPPGDAAPVAIVTLSAGKSEVAAGFSLPVLLIATTRDATGPASFYAESIAESLEGPHEVLILPGTESGLAILDAHWNAVREAVIEWFGTYTSEGEDG